MPSDAELMKIAIDDLNNSSIYLEDRLRALEELLILVEPIDNANGMYKTYSYGSFAGHLNRNRQHFFGSFPSFVPIFLGVIALRFIRLQHSLIGKTRT